MSERAETRTPGIRGLWSLDPGVRFLNHGSFGACPIEVLRYQSELRARLEREPVRFFVHELETLLDEVRDRLGAFVGAPPGHLVFVPNATTGVNTVLRSLEFAPGDEILVTDHAYPACRNALDAVAARAGARVVPVAIPFPTSGPDEIVARIVAHAGPRTRLALVDHVTSPTGLVLPVQRLVDELSARGIDTLVDGAHAPGMIDLAIETWRAAYYTGNCHKWVCAPKGAAFLYVRPDRQPRIRPLTISHGASSTRTDRSRFRIEFDWTGTSDPTAYLSIGRAIEYMGGLLPGGWEALRARNRSLALHARGVLARALGVDPPAPDEMIGSLVALPLPDGSPDPPASPLYLDPLQDALMGAHAIEVPIISWPSPPKRLVRISAQIYNEPEEYEALARAFRELF
jgi:isopenicillin-N epimerase